jgi:NTE family protein
MMLCFSGGGTRAAALSYGVLEELARTEIIVDGKRRRLLDEVSIISGVSGGSFPAAYYGLFGDRIFRDFEGKFLKKDIQGDLFRATFYNPINWVRLASGYFDRSDLAAEYYSENVFEKKTFADLSSVSRPLIIINATDMTYGIRMQFTQDFFDLICSDLATFPVGSACAASSAVPGVFSAITMRNYGGTCGYDTHEELRKRMIGRELSDRANFIARNVRPFLDSKKKPYIHLVDGGVADNLGLRAILDKLIMRGSLWNTIRGTKLEGMRKLVFVIVNAETEADTNWDTQDSIPSVAAMLSSYSTIAIERYNVETISLLKEQLKSWADEVRQERCRGRAMSTEPGACGDFSHYIIEVKFDEVTDEGKRSYFKRLPTSFRLTPEEVDNLRSVAQRLLTESAEYQRLLKDLK